VIYRDPLTDLRRRVAEKRAVVADARRALGPLRRAVLSPDALAAIETLDTATDAFDDASLRAVDERLDELADRLEAALQASSALLAALGDAELPEVAPRSLRWGTPIDVHDDVARALPDAELADWGALATGARLERDGVALFLLASALDGAPSLRVGTDRPAIFTLTLVVAVPRALPAFEADARGRLRGHLEVGRLLLGEPASLPEATSLALGDGRASLSWTARDLARVPEAIACLTRLRGAIDAARK
jgi:hypothetical protein